MGSTTIKPTLYGELAIIGFNGPIESAHRGRRFNNKIALYQRPFANGVRPGSVQHHIGSYDSIDSRGRGTHSVSYTLSRHETVVVEYVPDIRCDMFQIGRSTNEHIDFVVSEPRPARSRQRRGTSPKSPASTATPLAKGQSNDTKSAHPESAVSRFACRIHIQRDPPYTARIYAAGFDESNQIVLGELAVKWKSDGVMDGLTTNGVMIFRADCDRLCSSDLTPDASVAELQSQWREVSIGGSVYQMREKRCVPDQENKVDEDNVLRDMTLIDLCGVTLCWRSAFGLSTTLDSDQLKRMIDCLNEARFQCPVMYHTLRLSCLEQRCSPSQPIPKTRPSMSAIQNLSANDTQSEPYVYLNCGHVHGWHDWLAEGDHSSVPNGPIIRTCALCLQPSQFVPLRMGLEPAFHIDRALATHCFNPCGHMASEKTVRYWSSVPIPNNHNFEFRARCPFCLVPVESKPVRLRFSGDVDADTLAQHLKSALDLEISTPLSANKRVLPAI